MVRSNGGRMSGDPDLYRKPGALLSEELNRLKARLVVERAEVERFEGLAGKTTDELNELIWRAKDDAKETEKLVAEYRAAVKSLRVKR